MVVAHLHTHRMAVMAIRIRGRRNMGILSNRHIPSNSSPDRKQPDRTINHSLASSMVDHQTLQHSHLASLDSKDNHNAVVLLLEAAEHIMRICLGHQVMV
jgi:carbamoylphosphate synthase small subunit